MATLSVPFISLAQYPFSVGWDSLSVVYNWPLGHQGLLWIFSPLWGPAFWSTLSHQNVESRPPPVDLPFSSFPSSPQLVKPFFLGQEIDTSVLLLWASLRLPMRPSCHTAVPRHAVRTSLHVCGLHVTCETCSCSSCKGAGLSLDALGPIVWLKLKHSFMENGGMGNEAFRKLSHWPEWNQAPSYSIGQSGTTSTRWCLWWASGADDFSIFYKNWDIVDI